MSSPTPLHELQPAVIGRDPKIRRALLMLLASATFFGLMAVAAKLASARLGGGQIAMTRFALSLLPILLIPTWRRASFTWQRLDLLFYRGVFGGLAVLCFFIAIDNIPVGIATLLNYTAPVFSGLFAATFIGESLRLRSLIPLTVAFSGVVLVISVHQSPLPDVWLGPWIALGLLSAVLSGAAVTAIRIARRTEGSWAIFASFSAFGLLTTAPFGIAQWIWPTLLEWGLLVAVAGLSIIAQMLMTHAYRWVETVTAGVMSQFAVIVAMIIGVVWLGERVTPLSLLGSALTIGGVVAMMIVSSRPDRQVMA
jgi:drug/metabolite transporter (DMT)-like permease